MYNQNFMSALIPKLKMFPLNRIKFMTSVATYKLMEPMEHHNNEKLKTKLLKVNSCLAKSHRI